MSRIGNKPITVPEGVEVTLNDNTKVNVEIVETVEKPEIADKNAFLLTSIRNSIEHANFFDFNGSILLNDQSNQNDNTTINFACYGTASDYFEITNCLEMGNAEERFTFDDFLEELKTVIDTRTFNELIDVINQLKFINEEALISVLNQSMSK